MPANYVLLERIELNASAASITFSNIPQSGYTDLLVVMSARSTGTNGNAQGFCYLVFNGSTANFTSKRLIQDGTSVSSDSGGRFVAFIPNNAATASTFGTLNLYIPNYTSSNFKSWSTEQGMENNSSTNYLQGMSAGLWSNTAAINSITIDNVIDSSGSVFAFAQYSTFSLYGLAAVGTTPAIAPKASGGNITTDGTYWYHIFLSTGVFVPQTALSCDYLVVAGGGGGGGVGAVGSGGYDGGGGGGAGGFRTGTGLSVSAQAYTIQVGAGGNGGTGSGNAGTNGTNSTLSTITSTGGGGGASYIGAVNGISGGSGGGAAYLGTGGAASPSGQGNAGGNYVGGDNGAGGGGAGSTGSNAISGAAGNGGAGSSSSISGTSVTYAGGGGGGAWQSATTGSGGTGGGGTGGSNTNNGNSATINTGSGGGGAGATVGTTGTRTGGAGGSGIVIIRYAI